MKIYHYSRATGEYRGTGTADPDPLRPGGYLIPANSTTQAPPATGGNEVAVFETGQWVVKADYRGHVYYDTVTAEPRIVADIGKAPEPGWTIEPPSELTVWDGTAWVADLPAMIAKKLGTLNSELSAYIYGVYDAGTQASMQALYIGAGTPAEVKTDIESVWAWIASIMTYYYSRKSEIAAATDVRRVAESVWDFTRFDATRPDVTLQGIFEAIGGDE